MERSVIKSGECMMEIGHAVCIVSILGLLSGFDGFHIFSSFKKLRAFAMLPAVRI